jgi:hypothetical protein
MCRQHFDVYLKTETNSGFAIFQNNIVMGLGLLGISISLGYLAYMRHKYEQMGLYTAVDSEGQQTLHKRESRWL